MRLKKGSFSDFARRAESSGKPIVVYGAGVIGQVAAPYWLNTYQLAEQVRCYVDADPHKQGGAVAVGERAVPISPVSALEELGSGCLLLVTVSAFDAVVESLEKLSALRETEAWFLPVMLIERAHSLKSGGVVKTSETPLIPKKIHYCWFSGNPIPDSLKRCMETWEKFCPDYEIIRWDESNYDISWSPYMVQAYERKKWGFVPDVARLDILYRHGGIYLDTDVELVRGLDELLYQPAFCGVEKWGVINPGGCSGAQQGNHAIKTILEIRQNETFVLADGTCNSISSGYADTMGICRLGMSPNGKTQTISTTITVYASEFFHPFDYASGETVVTENTFSIHHFSGTWLGENAARERALTREKYRRFVDSLEETI
jgi:hypothetical protein